MAIELTLEEFLQGSLALIFIVISFIVGIKLLMKYFTHKQNTLLFAGLSWIFIVSPWFNTGFNFIYVIIAGVSMSDQIYLLLGYFWVPFPLVFWLALYTDLKYKKMQKKIITIAIIQGILYEIIFLYFIFTDISVIATKEGYFNDELTTPFLIYILVVLIIAIPTGISFGIESFKSENPEIKLKGKFIIAAWLSFFIGALLDAGVFAFTALLLIFVRVLLMTSAIEFYFGFFLPKWVKEILIKQK